jgi:hypothetical protein
LKEVFETQKKKKTTIKTITKIFIVSAAVIVISLSIYKGRIHLNNLKDFIVSQTKKIKKEAEKRKTEEKKVVTEPTVTSRESKPQNICIIKVPFDQDISTISSKKGIKEAKIEFLTKKERKIMFYIGDFISSHDAVFVSARLNDKGIQHIVKNVGNKWRVYLFLDSPSLEFYKKKENITRKDLDDIEKFASSKVGEVVKAEIVDEETLENIITFIFLSQKDCEEFFSSLMKLGKKAEKEIKINI